VNRRIGLALGLGVLSVVVVVVVVIISSSAVDGGDATIRQSAPEPEPVAEQALPPQTGDALVGKGVFAQAGCGNCHTLEAAGSTGAIGPVLDGRSPNYQVILEQVIAGGGGMPSYGGTLSAEEIQDVVAFTIEAIDAGSAIP
jgi:mono/diheme cytochrome c family protein